MSTIEESIYVNVPIRKVYSQWTQFEEFPLFMAGILEVRQLDDKRSHWRTNIGGKEKDFIAEITEQLPGKRIAWRSRSGASHAGVVTFHALNDRQTRIMIQMEYEPEGIIETAGDALGFPTRRIENDLERFKEFIESRSSRRPPGVCRIERGLDPQ
jgi:uncharacterized membrane protein